MGVILHCANMEAGAAWHPFCPTTTQFYQTETTDLSTRPPIDVSTTQGAANRQLMW